MLAQWHSSRALDLLSIGRGFSFHCDKAAEQPWSSCSHLCASVTSIISWYLSRDGDVLRLGRCLAESYGSLPPGDDLKSRMRTDCLYSGIISGPNDKLLVLYRTLVGKTRSVHYGVITTQERKVWSTSLTVLIVTALMRRARSFIASSTIARCVMLSFSFLPTSKIYQKVCIFYLCTSIAFTEFTSDDTIISNHWTLKPAVVIWLEFVEL